MRTVLKMAIISGMMLCAPTFALAAAPSEETLAKVQAKLEQLRELSTDATLIAAVQAYNAQPPAAAQTMTNENWKNLTVFDPFVKSLIKNSLVDYLKGKKDPAISELFVSGADGGKIAFFSKTTRWTHKGQDKHELPMQGKTWIGPVEIDESTGVEQIQVSLPILNGNTSIGSIVLGLAVAKINLNAK